MSKSKFTETTVFASKATNFNNIPFMKVKDNNGYQYAERLGTDSIAFILIDQSREEDVFAVINERKPPMDCILNKEVFMETAFGGSLDSELSAIDTVKAECWEEAGYKVDIDRITYMGEVLVSTQMNQMCKLYVVDVTELIQGSGDPQNEMEAQATVCWRTIEQIMTGPDWKAITLVAKILIMDK